MRQGWLAGVFLFSRPHRLRITAHQETRMDNTMGEMLKRSLIAGSPSRMKSASDYTGMPIPVCGEYAHPTSGDTRPPWLSEGTKPETYVTRSSRHSYI